MNAYLVEARRWFAQAQADLAVVRTLLAAGHYAAACFHAQQSAEKALKAVLYSQGNREVWGHSVRDLAQRCEAHDPTFAEIVRDASLLDQFYIAARYPNGLPAPAVPSETYTTEQAQAAQRAADHVLEAVEAFLRRHTRVLN